MILWKECYLPFFRGVHHVVYPLYCFIRRHSPPAIHPSHSPASHRHQLSVSRCRLLPLPFPPHTAAVVAPMGATAYLLYSKGPVLPLSHQFGRSLQLSLWWLIAACPLHLSLLAAPDPRRHRPHHLPLNMTVVPYLLYSLFPGWREEIVPQNHSQNSKKLIKHLVFFGGGGL